MVTALYAIVPAVGPHRLVVDRVKARQFGHKMASKPGKRLGPAQPADRQLQVGAAPPTFQGPATARETLSQVLGSFPQMDDCWPQLIDQRGEVPAPGFFLKLGSEC